MGYFKDLIQGMGTSVGGGMAGSIGGQIGYGLGELTGYNDALQKRQLDQQRALTDMQKNANMALMKDSYKQQLQLWKDTNYGAQMAQIKSAGLNPALIYGTSGTGGSTGSGGASVGGGNASGESERMMAYNAQSANGMAMMKTAAEIELIKANADLARAQKPKTEADTDLSKANVDKVNSEIANIKNDTALKGEEIVLNKLQQNSIQISNEFNEQHNVQLLEQTFQSIKELTARANVAEETQNSLIELAKNNVKLSLSQTLLNNSNISLNEADKKLIQAKIEEIANTIAISNRQITVNEEALKQAMEMKKMEQSSGELVKTIRGVGSLIQSVLANKPIYDLK